MSEEKKKISLRSILWFAFVLIAFLSVMGGVWLGSRYYVINKAEKDIQTMLLQHKGVHHYVQRLAHPELYALKQDSRIPESLYTPILFSSSYMVRNTHDFYNEERKKIGLSELYYKMAAENPRNPINKADEFESDLIRMFNKKDAPQNFRQVIEKNGRKYLYVATPFLPNSQRCLKCHGRYEDAPLQLQERYLERGGFDEKIGYIRAIESLRAPLDGELTIAYIALISVSVVCSIVFLLLLLNRRLDSLVIERTQLIEKQASALSESEENLAITLNSIGDAVIATDEYCCITLMNPVAEKLTGYPLASAKGKHLQTVFNIVNSDGLEASVNPAQHILEKGQPFDFPDSLIKAKDGTERLVSNSGAPIHNADGIIVGMVLVFKDVTREKEVEEHLRQTEKMSAVGQLAGGVAHDFNNMLGGISGAAELLEMTVPNNPQAMKYIDMIKNATERTSGLTHKLLAFSRKGKLVSTPVDIHTIIMDAVSILERSIDKRITISTNLKAELSMVVGDPSQLQNGFLNLFVNARDAMPEGGELFIATVNTFFDKDYCQVDSTLLSNTYIHISVQDTGSGIPEEVQSHIFEPFYTTKEIGKGTGLGLAAVYGMIQDHHGNIRLYSEPDKGTVFNIYLPTSSENTSLKAQKNEQNYHGSGTILLIDDEEIIRTTGSQLLVHLGYNVMLAEDGAQGVAVYQENIDKIDLVILDIVMPVMNGKEAFDRIIGFNPKAKVIMSSGFAKDIEMADMMSKGLSGFIMKPFNQFQLSKLVAEVIES